MSRKKQRQKKATTRAASAAPTVARMSRAPGRTSAWPTQPDATSSAPPAPASHVAPAPARVSSVPPQPEARPGWGSRAPRLSSSAAQPAATSTPRAASTPPRRSISPWARDAEAKTHAASPQPVSEVVPVPRHAQPAASATLPHPPVVGRADPTPPRVDRDSPHHWSDPPPRLEPLTQPFGAPSSGPTPYFTVPATHSTPGAPQPVHAAPIAAAPIAAAPASEPMGSTAEVAKPTHKTPPRGVETARVSDPGMRDSGEHFDHEHFFSSSAQRQSLSNTTWDEPDEPPRPMTYGSKRAMVTTFWILGVSLTVIGAFVIYNQVIMPAPAPLAGGSTLALPTPAAAPSEPSTNAAPVPPTPAIAPTPTPIAQPAPQAAATPTATTTPTGTTVGEPELPENEPDPESYELPENDPDTVGTETTAVAEASESYRDLIAQAEAFQRQGKRQRALEAYELAAAANPNGDEALSKLAYHYLNTGKNEEARQYAQRAVAANPKSSEGWIVLGAAREALRDREGAAEAYRQCATIAEGSFVAECKRLSR